MKKDDVTIADLAGMVARGFEKTDRKLDEVHLELKDFKLDTKQRLGKLEYQMDDVHDILKRFEENDWA